MDTNAVIAGLLRDVATIQTDKQKAFGYKRAAAVVFELDRQLDTLVLSDGSLPKIAGMGPATSRIALEVLYTGTSQTVDRAVTESATTAVVETRRGFSHAFLSRAAVVGILADKTLRAVKRDDYRGDLQMHSEWSDGSQTIEALATGALERNYGFIGVTDHSHGLAIAGGMTMAEVAAQHQEIDQVNETLRGRFRVIKGIEANISADGDLDLSPEEMSVFELVLAAPHSQLRRPEDQTARMLRAISLPGVHILAHPRGRLAGTRAGVVADWDRVFELAARIGVAIEIDGDPSRQDLDHALAKRAFDAGCTFALDSDAHATDQFSYADTAIAHARLAGIPAKRIINCWPTDALMEWLRGARGTRLHTRQRRRTISSPK